MRSKSIFFLILLLTFPLTTASHWIVGYVEDALDATSPNGRTVRLYNPSTMEEIFSTIGPTGPSATSNVYMLDCETLNTPCTVGDTLNITLVDDGTGHVANQIVQVVVSDAGYDMAPNITMNSPPSLSNEKVEDIYTSPENEIDLTPNSTQEVFCTAITSDYEGDASIINASAKFYLSSVSPNDPNDNNSHYTNSSCQINTSYGSSLEAAINCTFQIQYYANSDNWDCQINVTDNATASTTATDTTSINPLLSIGTNSFLYFGEIDSETLSDEKNITITNYGNVKINLSLSGYGQEINDNKSMICLEKNISIEHTKYNLTSSNSGPLTLEQSESVYANLSSSPVVEKFNLNSRQSDLVNDAINDTYWRIYLPSGAREPCQGNIVLGATQS